MIDETAVEALTEPDPLVGFTQEEADVAAKLLPALTKKITDAAEARFSADYRAKWDAVQTTNAEALKTAIEELRESAKPLSPDELGKLLSQEYVEIKAILPGTIGTTVTYVIRELPVSAEKRLVRAVKASIGPILEVVASTEWASLAGASQMERLRTVIDLVPGALDTLAECVAICLDPGAENAAMTGAWVTKTLGMNRMIHILTAQIEASRYRDFFSLVSRLFQQTRMTTV